MGGGAKPKTIFITGGNRGIGLELVKQILTNFAPTYLFASYRDIGRSKELLELATKYPNLRPITMDLGDFDSFEKVVKEVDETTAGAGVNLLINNSGILDHSKQSLDATSAFSLNNHYNINSVAPILFTKAFVPLLKKGANSNPKAPLGADRALVVNITSLMGSVADNTSGGYYAYRMSKTALNIGTKSLSVDLKKDNILALVVHPGWVKTDMGGQSATLTVETCVNGILNVISSVNEGSNGKFFNFNGKELPW